MERKEFRTKDFHAEIRFDSYFFVREIKNGLPGGVIDGNPKGRGWAKKMEALLSSAVCNGLNFQQVCDSVIGNCKNYNYNQY